MILGELEFTLYVDSDSAQPISAEHVRDGRDTRTDRPVTTQRVAEDAVEKSGENFVLSEQPKIRVDARAFKMSKSRGNVVNPDDVVGTYGADAFRLYEMFMGPLEQVKPWNTRGVEGTHRFLNRVWRLFADGDTLSDRISDDEASKDQLILTHQTIAKVTDDIEALRFNTAIAALMEFSNAAGRWPALPRDIARSFVLLLAPLAPHIAEELWARLGEAGSLAYAPWPRADSAYLQRDTLEVAVQVNGKVRGRIEIPADAAEDEVLEIAKSDANVQRHLEGHEIKRAIYVPQKIVNFVVRS
jgi:leucyl-tRNA synthetase